jgi:hypothetical protein
MLGWPEVLVATQPTRCFGMAADAKRWRVEGNGAYIRPQPEVKTEDPDFSPFDSTIRLDSTILLDSTIRFDSTILRDSTIRLDSTILLIRLPLRAH